MMLHCTEPFIITIPLSEYDLDNVERDIKHQIIISAHTDQGLNIWAQLFKANDIIS